MTTQTALPPWGGRLLRAMAGAAFGMAAVVPLLRFGGPTLVAGGTGAIALSGVALIYLLMAAFVGLGTLMPRPGSKLLNVDGPEDLADQRIVLLGSSASSLAIGAALMLLAFSGPVGVVPDTMALSGLAFATVLCVMIGILQRRHQDELMRQLSNEAGSIAFTICVPLLGGWAGLAYLGRAAPLEPLWVIAAFATVLLIASFIAAGRRGLLEQDRT